MFPSLAHGGISPAKPKTITIFNLCPFVFFYEHYNYAASGLMPHYVRVILQTEAEAETNGAAETNGTAEAAPAAETEAATEGEKAKEISHEEQQSEY